MLGILDVVPIGGPASYIFTETPGVTSSITSTIKDATAFKADYSISLGDYNPARNSAMDWLVDKGFKADQVNLGKFGDTKGQPIGML